MPGGQNLIICILGVKGSGKSTLAREIIMGYPRVLILDASGEYEDLPGAKVVEGAPDCIAELLQLQHEERWILDCEFLRTEEALDILAVAFEIPGILIVLEEASLYCDPYRFPDEIARIVRYGRKRAIDMVVIARRPSEINRELTAQSDLVVSFKQMEPIDVAYLRARGGTNAEAVQTLPDWSVVIVGDVERAPLPVLARLPGPRAPKIKRRTPWRKRKKLTDDDDVP